MKEKAKLLVNTRAGIRVDENVIIVAEAEHMEFAAVIEEEVIEAGSFSDIVNYSDELFCRDDPDLNIVKKLLAADVLLLLLKDDRTGLSVFSDAAEKGARVFPVEVEPLCR